MPKNKVPLDWKICKKEFSKLKLTEDSKILDIGSGDGKKIHHIVTKGKLIMSDIILTSATSRPLVKADTRYLPFKDNSFDLVTILHVIEHIKEDRIVSKEIYRVLKRNGVVLLVTPNTKRFTKIYSFVLEAVTGCPYKYPLNPDHVFEYSFSDIKKLLENSEFTKYKIRPIFMRISRFLRIKKYCNQWIVVAKSSVQDNV